jgi:hypothetical protein
VPLKDECAVMMMLKFNIMPAFPQCQLHFNILPLGGGHIGINFVGGVVKMLETVVCKYRHG